MTGVPLAVGVPTVKVRRRKRYRYYICHSRGRYGVGSCRGDNLPADELSEALVRTLGRYDLVQEAVRKAQDLAQSARPLHKEELEGLVSEIHKAEASLERYFAAFESGSMPERLCAPRIESMTEKLAQLRNREAELVARVESEPRIRVTRDQLGDLLGLVRAVLGEGLAPEVKALLHALVAEVRVQSRRAIQPVFRVPSDGVRILDRVVGREGLEPIAAACPVVDGGEATELSDATMRIPLCNACGTSVCAGLVTTVTT